MANMKNSNDRIILFRKAGEKVDATKMLFLTEYGLSHEADTDTVQWMVLITLVVQLNQQCLELPKCLMVTILQKTLKMQL